MDTNYILLWLVFAYSLFSLVQLLRTRRPDNRLWIIKNAFVCAVSLLLLYLLPEWAGYAGAALWCILILIPLLGMRLVTNLNLHEFYAAARLVCTICGLFHPDHGFKTSRVLLQARLWAKQGKKTQAAAYLRAYRDKTGSLYGIATAYMYLFEQNWEELLHWFKGIGLNITLLPLYCRVLGETGEFRLLAQVPFTHVSLFEKQNYYSKNMIRLYIFAFGGEAAQVEKLFDGALSGLGGGQKAYWRAVVLQSSGRREEARAVLERLEQGRNHILKDMAARRLRLAAAGTTAAGGPELAAAGPASTHGVGRGADELRHEDTDQSADLIGRLAIDFDREERYSLFKKIRRHKAWVTLALIAVNLAVFAGEELLGGSTNEVTLYAMGALYTVGVAAGDLWRLLSAQFLHFGLLHLTMNMLGLFILGPHVERVMGRIRYALIYLLSGTAALGCFLLVAIISGTQDFLVGASAGIMGVVGALLALLCKGFFAYRMRIIRSQLFILVFFILLQITFDLYTPEVSFLGHLFGLVFGFMITWLFLLKEKGE
jgi:rhomboid protease GluP